MLEDWRIFGDRIKSEERLILAGSRRARRLKMLDIKEADRRLEGWNSRWKLVKKTANQDDSRNDQRRGAFESNG